ncbi:hypothetical protein LUZ63_000388 [Rhynchospora breviuscula]|uniref:Uncharacterized protein n=1 Tax=Rhynchospora breviuscula TaxID=2022672 RepID=A0A9Q0CW84_9POAL|nr:hypothetical protein LUZ63_000388 [Rhynchospora breviuscula]
MNTRGSKVRGMREAPRHDKGMEKEKKIEKITKKTVNNPKRTLNRLQARRERKIALQQDVDKLKKKLRHEENVHRALERAFTRPIGALPRLPPYLPSHTLELLAEVAVLEEEVMRLEEQVVNFRQGLYQEAIISSNSQKSRESSPDLKLNSQTANSELPVSIKPTTPVQLPSNPEPIGPSSNRIRNGRQVPRKQSSPNLGKENQSNTNSIRNFRQSPVKKAPISKTRTEKQPNTKAEKSVLNKKGGEDVHIIPNSDKEAKLDGLSDPNKLSEEILKCLMSIFSQMSLSEKTEDEQNTSPSVSGSSSASSDSTDLWDPYGILDFGKRDIGSYKSFRVVDGCSFNPNLVGDSSLLIKRLKGLHGKLAAVDLIGLTHQQKLAFWINIYNACMMNAFLEQGIPTTPQMLVALLPKATINIGGQLLSAMTIEHFILRLPFDIKHVDPKGMKGDLTMRGTFGLEWPEPLVTFALSCGSWSSPAVRVYTPSHVEQQLETAKKDYLQASIGISNPSKLAIPKLLHWYLLDFAKDMESLMDWICMQLPDHMTGNAVRCLEISKSNAYSVQVLPYEFRFRFLLAI